MRARRCLVWLTAAMTLCSVGWLLGGRPASAHCDTLAGPVVADARVALERGQVDVVLKWVGEADEAEVQAAFADAVAMRPLAEPARTVGEMRFYETLVRLHRAGEGEPFTGLKPAAEIEPIVRMTDAALDQGSPDAVVHELTAAVEAGIRQRFAEVGERRLRAADSVEAGRAYVASYVEWTHYVERLHAAANPTEEHGDAHGGHGGG